METLNNKRARTDGAPGPNTAKMDLKDTTTMTVTPSSNPFGTNPEFIYMLTKMKAEQIPISDGKIFVCQRSDKVVDVWKGLIQHKFLSVPVLQKTGNKYYGFVDLADIVKFVVETFGETRLKENAENFWELANKEEFFQSRTVNDIMTYPLSKRNPFHPVTRGYSVFHAMELLSRERGLHRVPVIDDNRKLVHMITQSQLIEFLSKNLEHLGGIRQKPIGQMKDITKEVITIKESETAMTAFQTMINKNISGLAILNDEGKLAGSISLRDLKVISTDGRLFWRLYQNLTFFIQRVKHESSADDRPRTIVFCRMEDTFETVLKKLLDHRVHRIFITDNERKPIGVISLKDLLMELITS